jgi:ATP-binding cassette subfamily B protein
MNYKVFKKVFPYVKKCIPNYIFGFLALLGTTICQIYTPWVFKLSIDALNKPNALNDLLKYSILILLLGIGLSVARYFWRMFLLPTARMIEYNLRNDYLLKLQNLPASFYQKMYTGDIMSRAINDLNAVRDFFGEGIIIGFDIIVTGLFTIFMMARINLELTLYIFPLLPIIAIIIKILRKKIHIRYEKVQELLSSLSTFVQETFSGIRIIQAQAQEKSQIESFNNLSKDYIDKNLKLAKVNSAFGPILTLLGGFAVFIILFKGGIDVVKGRMTLGGLIAFYTYLGLLFWPMIALSWVTILYQRAVTSMQRINQILDYPEIEDKIETKREIKIKKNIRFENVSFSYDGENVLNDFNLQLPANKIIAIVGPTASGKSTLVKLITRLFEPKSGRILFDDIPINSVSIHELRDKIGFVSQEPFLFSDTIKENIAFRSSIIDIESVENAAKLASIHEEISGFPNKYDTVIGERGVTLSAGQKQRIAIARAALTNPPLLILDDSFSNIDEETAQNIMKNLKENKNQQTIIIVTHRLSILPLVDIIVVLDKGKVVGVGSHYDLLKTCELYQQMIT